jgi:hypothetical protein
MSTPIIETIAANIKTTIDAITTDAGYNQTLIGHRPRRVDFIDQNLDDKDVLIVQTDMESSDEERPITSAQWRQHFDIVAYIVDPDTSTETIDTRINQVAADIMKALMVDPNRGFTDGSVVDTTIHKAAMLVDESGVTTGVVLDISVLYRTKFNDPYTAI